MTDHLKFIVGELNKEPFSKHYNLINFDSLEPLELLQLLSDVVCTIEGQASIDIRQEPADETALRLFNTLRIMKFRAPVDPDEISAFRQGLIEGEQQAIYPVLEWLLQRVPELQQRSYLARYLVKVDIPPDCYGDPEIQELAAQCDELMESFKEIHKDATASKAEGLSTEDIRQDIHQMEQEKEQITRRIDKLKRKTESIPSKEKTLDLARQLRLENEKAQTLELQKLEQRNGMMHVEQKIQRLVQLIKETKQEADSLRPEDLIRKLEEENKIQRYMVEDKLPKEIALKRKAVQELQKVVAQPAMQKSDLEEITAKTQEVNDEIQRLVEQKNLQSDPTEDKIGIFKQQAAIVERKKDAAAEKLQEVRSDLARIESDLREKKAQMRDPEGNEIVTSVQFKNYVNKLRSKTNVYKKKRSELQDLRAEIGVLARTEEILKAQMEHMRSEAEASGVPMIEEDDGDMVDSGSKPPARPMTAMARADGTSLTQLQRIVESLVKKLEQRRMDLNPLLQELRPLREQFQEMSDTYTANKQQFDAQAASLESGYSRLEQDVKRLRDEVNQADSTFFLLDTEKKILETLMERAENETRSIEAEDGGGRRGESFRDVLQNVINKAEDEGKRLREEQKNVGDDQQDAARQMKLWRDFTRIMECKKNIMLQTNPHLRGSSGQSGGRASTASRVGSGRMGSASSVRIGSGRPQSRQRDF